MGSPATFGDVAVIFPDIQGERPPHAGEIAALAARQHGVVARRQLLKLGLGAGAIDHRLAEGGLHRVHAGVYAVGHMALAPRGRLMAAVLACGEGAVLSHRCAAAHWELRASAQRAVDVTVVGEGRRSRPGIVVHRARRLHPDDRALRLGIPVTAVARTLLDLAEVLPRDQVQRAFEEAERLRLLDLRAIESLCRRSHGRRGLRPLLALLAHARSAPATRSELERRFLQLCRDAALPLPAVNVLVEGFEVDALWRTQKLIVELDSHAFHRNQAAFERDRVRDAALQLAGYRVVRITSRRLDTAPSVVVQTITALLGQGPRQG